MARKKAKAKKKAKPKRAAKKTAKKVKEKAGKKAKKKAAKKAAKKPKARAEKKAGRKVQQRETAPGKAMPAIEETVRATEKVEPIAREDRVGAALVVGGGIGGIQAALDLADSGIKVYLVDRKPSIGGVMSQLDKTFPTNDCSLCILSPKMVEAGRHRNIELLMYSELKGLEGAPGRFRAKILHRARSVDMTKCTGCGICTQECLVHNRIVQPEPTDVESDLSAEDRKYLQGVVAEHRGRAGALMQAMQDIQRDLRYLPKPFLRYVARSLDVPLAQAYGVATFYTRFSLEPKGKHLIQVCTGTACHVRGSGLILDRFQRELEIGPAETTADGEFTLETVRCLGCCGLAPAVVIDGKTYGRVKPDGVPGLLGQYRKVAV